MNNRLRVKKISVRNGEVTFLRSNTPDIKAGSSGIVRSYYQPSESSVSRLMTLHRRYRELFV